jgi:hypothetical protein
MGSEEKYFNFPIQLLGGFMVDCDKSLMNILHYAIYVQSTKNNLHGSEAKRINDCANYFNVSIGSATNIAKNGKELLDSLPEKSPMAGIRTTMFWDFYKKDKSDFEKACLLGYLAIRSILGNKESTKTNNNHWLARMNGQPKAQIETLKDGIGNYANEYKVIVSAEINKYANEYQLKKIKTELRTNWGLVTYSRYTKGFYISYKLELKALILIAETARKSNKELEYKLKEKELLRVALQELNTRPLHDLKKKT